MPVTPKHQGSWYDQLPDNHGIVDEQMVGLASVFLLFTLQIRSAKSSLTHRKIVKNCQKVVPTDIGGSSMRAGHISTRQ